MPQDKITRGQSANIKMPPNQTPKMNERHAFLLIILIVIQQMYS